MEFIKNLDNSHPAGGLRPKNLTNLEKTLKEATGDKQEIDIVTFKKIFQSKNAFFAERVFKIFDVDNTGSVSLEDFVRILRCFSSLNPQEKLRYLFDVYDLNDDGSIQFMEIRNVINECMKENGLKFSDCEIDELARMLFNDADVDGSGNITFNEFRDQICRYPAFMENLSFSVERWLLQPESSTKQRFNKFHFKKFDRNYIRNNWTNVTFLVIYLLLNVCLFTSRAIQYSDNNIFVILARACGQCLNFNCAFVLVLVLRKTLTLLRTHGFAEYLPIDQHLYYHKLTGCFILGYSVLHTVMHICNFHDVSVKEGVSFLTLLISTKSENGEIKGSASLTGWILILILCIMLLSAMPIVRRSRKFEVFYYLHQLAIPFWVCLILHGPSFWMWLIAPALLYIIETAIRIKYYFFNNMKTCVQQGVLLPSNVTQLVIQRSPKFDYRPGDFVFINVPTIAKYEWHPFTISSAPEMDGVIWLHIRGVGGWTKSLYDFFDRQEKEAVLSDKLANDLKISNPNQGVTSHLTVPSSEDSTVSTLCNQSYANGRKKRFVGRSVSEAPNNGKYYHKNKNFCIEDPNSDTSSYPTSIGSQIADELSENTEFRTKSMSFNGSKDGSTNVVALQYRALEAMEEGPPLTSATMPSYFRLPSVTRDIKFSKEKRRSVKVSMAHKGLRRCQTIVLLPSIDDDDDGVVEFSPNAALNNYLKGGDSLVNAAEKSEAENVVVTQKPLEIFLDGPYGSPTRHIFQAKHAVLIATGIGVTPFASILQSIMCQYRKSRLICPNCQHKWTEPKPISSLQLRKVDFIWLNRNQRSFEWFVSLLSELEIEQAQLQEQDRFLDMHMYITSALDRTDMKAVGLQMALDLLYQKEKRCLITGLKSRTQPGRPNWTEVFRNISKQNKGKVTVFFCGPAQLAKTLQSKCDEFGFRFRKEIF